MRDIKQAAGALHESKIVGAVLKHPIVQASADFVKKYNPAVQIAALGINTVQAIIDTIPDVKGLYQEGRLADLALNIGSRALQTTINVGTAYAGYLAVGSAATAVATGGLAAVATAPVILPVLGVVALGYGANYLYEKITDYREQNFIPRDTEEANLAATKPVTAASALSQQPHQAQAPSLAPASQSVAAVASGPAVAREIPLHQPGTTVDHYTSQAKIAAARPAATASGGTETTATVG